MNRPAFTIIELIIVLAIFAIAAATTLPFLGRFQQSESLLTITQDVTHALRTAQQKAMAGEYGSNWGVRFENGAYILYAGPNFQERQKQFDRRHGTPRTLHFIGNHDVNFQEGTGVPTSGTGVLLLQPPEGTGSHITINTVGGIFPDRP